MSFAFRRVSSMRKLMWASLAVNLFLIGALAGSVATGLPLFHSFKRPPSPPGFDGGGGDPPGVRMLNNVRSRLSDEGKMIFDAEFRDLIEDMRNHPDPRMLIDQLRETLEQSNVSDAEIRAAYEVLKRAIGDDVGNMLDSMANVAVKLSSEDRLQMTLIGPGGMPPPRRD
ncbi:hypothetical protein ACQ0MK_16130 [Thalassospira lucentensis]|uniref:hypothetical protein n=1 Tax=Thalassospira lucentensis TaxID=168935 RepID=UPI003D2EA24C